MKTWSKFQTSAEKKWIKFDDARPIKTGLCWFRAPAKEHGNLLIQTEWVDEITMCGMGYDKSQPWPISLTHWDGYRRTNQEQETEWRYPEPDESVKAYQAIFIGFDLKTCPFCGGNPKIEAKHNTVYYPVTFAKEFILNCCISRIGPASAESVQDRWNNRKGVLFN